MAQRIEAIREVLEARGQRLALPLIITPLVTILPPVTQKLLLCTRGTIHREICRLLSKAVFHKLLKVFSVHPNPYAKLNVLYKLEHLIIAFLTSLRRTRSKV
jgi:hypothetical protein